MSQRVSGYERLADDKYCTPSWVTEALLPHLRLLPGDHVYEPAIGDGHIARVLKRRGFKVSGGDIASGRDFLRKRRLYVAAVITNPPYGQAAHFIQHALALMKPHGLVAMLLRTDYDHAATRSHLFEHPFAKRIVLRKRIRWIEGSTGSPSFNHAWYLWDWQHSGPPVIGYAP